MAQEFGGKFSPGASPAAASASAPPGGKLTPRPKAGFRAWLMFVAPLPLVFTGFGQITAANPAGILRDFGAFALMILGAFLLREGLKAEAAFLANPTARKPAFPRKIFAAVLTGLGVTLALTGGEGAIVVPPFLGLLAALFHLGAFGLDPLKNRVIDSVDALSGRRAARAIDEAEELITSMQSAMSGLRDRALDKRMADFVATAREMFRTVEQDPRDLVAARKYLSVYLVGARDATQKFVSLYAKTGDKGARADFEALLGDLETNFRARQQELLLDDRSDLDVEIDVLRDRLRREGVSSQ
jgi:hypothetical protein